MKLSCIAIDDEPLALEKLGGFIRQTGLLELRATFTDAVDSLQYLKEHPADLLFLDVRMKTLSGIGLLQALAVKPKVVITSAYDEYALKGYELNVSDYLLKPFSFERFLKAVDKVHDELVPERASKRQEDYIFVKTEYRIEKVSVNEILYVEGMNDYLRIVTAQRKIMTLQTFKTLGELLPANRFSRVHKSFLVALPRIESIERNRIRIGETIIPIGNGYAEGFYSQIRDLGIFR